LPPLLGAHVHRCYSKSVNDFQICHILFSWSPGRVSLVCSNQLLWLISAFHFSTLDPLGVTYIYFSLVVPFKKLLRDFNRCFVFWSLCTTCRVSIFIFVLSQSTCTDSLMWGEAIIPESMYSFLIVAVFKHLVIILHVSFQDMFSLFALANASYCTRIFPCREAWRVFLMACDSAPHADPTSFLSRLFLVFTLSFVLFAMFLVRRWSV